MDEWETLIARYADGKPLCNCRQAYYTPCGHGIVWKDGVREERRDLLACQHGCSANLINAKDYIAKRVIAELPPTPEGATQHG